MASELDLYNRALSALGQDTLIFDLDEDPPSRPLRVARALAPAAYDALMRPYPWRCATRRRSLAKLILDPAAIDWKFPSAFALPEATLLVWGVEGCREWNRGLARAVDGTQRDAILASGDGPLNVTLIERVSYDRLDPLLFDAVALELASRMAGPLQADKTLGRAVKQDAKEALVLAVGADAIEAGNEPALIESPWIAAHAGAVVGAAGA